MLGNFMYCNPTKLYFGEDSLASLNEELPKYGQNVQLVYGGGSIKKNGIYDKVMEILKANGKNVLEDAGVMPNPTVQKLQEGCKIAREGKADLILAVGGGSVCDYAKAVSVSAYCTEDPWEKYYLQMKDVDNEIIPVGCVLTMVGTGSEMNGGAVITNHEQKLKIGHVFDERVYPKFSILNPVYTYTLPQYQMAAGIYDIMNHITEQYFSGEDDNTSDYLMEGLLRSLIYSSRIAVKNPTDYEARSNIMWIATWALNTLVAKGKSTDWMVHMLGQAVAAHTDATHGMTLAAVSMAYYRLICPFGLANWYVEELTEFLPQVDTVPAVVQNEIHPYYQENDVIPFIQDLGIVVQGWYPLGGRGHTGELLGDSVISEIAEAHGVSSAQVILRWNLQKGVVVIPGSSNPDHIRENTEVYHFSLTEGEMARIGALDRGEKHDWY